MVSSSSLSSKSDNITKDANVRGWPLEEVEEKINDNSLAVRDDGDDSEDVSEVTAIRLRTRVCNSWRRMLMLFVVVTLIICCQSAFTALLIS